MFQVTTTKYYTPPDGVISIPNEENPVGAATIDGYNMNRAASCQTNQDKPVHTKCVVGKLKWFNLKKGYKFIARDDNHDAFRSRDRHSPYGTSEFLTNRRRRRDPKV